MLYEGLLALGIGGLIWLGQLLTGPLGHVSLLEGLGEAGNWHVLPAALALVILLHTVNVCWAMYNQAGIPAEHDMMLGALSCFSSWGKDSPAVDTCTMSACAFDATQPSGDWDWTHRYAFCYCGRAPHVTLCAPQAAHSLSEWICH